ncbi:hypothetical protein IAQ61_001513 [Plenodomus lingam]|uniref:uncharacterized protein n=1 Tax=Leptosphaeria maculans TaxID=5022 RepID=UPI003333BB29|nr:hypothetical protein IAQ61_001513 [Plenodomus lingam]
MFPFLSFSIFLHYLQASSSESEDVGSDICFRAGIRGWAWDLVGLGRQVWTSTLFDVRLDLDFGMELISAWTGIDETGKGRYCSHNIEKQNRFQ